MLSHRPEPLARRGNCCENSSSSPPGTFMKNIDTLINARWVIPVEPESVVLEHHSVALANGRIVAVLPTAEARGQFKAHETIELDNHALIPGLVNAHTHAAMSLFRGLADDLPLWCSRTTDSGSTGI